MEGVHQGIVSRILMGEYHRRKTVLMKCRTQKIWFEIFVRGVNLRVGNKSRKDQEISIEVMNLSMKNM